MSATARFILVGDDRTRAAIQSVERGFKKLQQSAKTTASVTKTALSLFAGVQVKKLFQGIIEATAESEAGQHGFAQALDRVKKSAHDLLVVKDGLPGVTRNLEEMADLLRDPSIRSAADSLFSTLIGGATAFANHIARGVAGWKILLTGEGGNALVDLDTKIRAREAQLARLTQRGEPTAGVGRQRAAELRAELEDLRRQYRDLSSRPPPRAEESATWWKGGNPMKRFRADQEIALFEENSRWLDQESKSVDKAIEEVMRSVGSIEEFWDDLRTENIEETEVYLQRLRDLFKDDWELQANRTKESVELMDEYTRQAARNMQDAFADFLFDPFSDGLDGMLKGFVDVVRRMVAEAAAAKIFGSTANGGLGLGSILSGFFGGLLGFANGGSFTVGGRPGTDANVVAFRATRGERVDIRTPSQQRAGGATVTVAPTYHIDARGATHDLVKVLPAVLEQTVQRSVQLARQAVRDDLDRKAL